MNISQNFINKARYRSKLTITLIVCNIALSTFYYGYLNNSFSTLNIVTMIQIFQIPLSPGTALGVVNGIIPLSSIVGAAINYHFVTKLSRRRILLMTNCIAFVAGLIIFIRNFYTLLFGRFVQGACIGCYITMAPLIIREIAPTEIAGVLGSITQIFMTGGVAFVCVFQYVLAQVFEDKECWIIWPYVFGFPLVTLTLQTLILLFVFPYETPKYLIGIGDKAGARELIETLYKQNYYEEVEMEKIEDFKSKQIHDKEMSELDNQFYGGHSILLKFKSNAGIIALIISTMQQLTGINPISLYGYQVAKDSIESIRELVPSIINSIQLVGTIKSSFLLHRYGRKDLFVYGSLGLSISLMILFVGLITQGISNGFGTFLVLLGLCMFSLIFGMTIAPCTWLYISQIIDPQLMPYTAAANRLSAFLSILLFPIVTSNILNGDSSPLFIFFSALMYGNYVFCSRYIIETKGKVQKQIRLEFGALRWRN